MYIFIICIVSIGNMFNTIINIIIDKQQQTNKQTTTTTQLLNSKKHKKNKKHINKFSFNL